jgi:hypothetical protein
MRLVAAVVTLAVAVVLSAKCVMAKDMTPEQKACCAAMGHDCGALAIEKGCCSGEAMKIDGVAPLAAPELSPPPVVVLAAVRDVLLAPAIRGVFASAIGAQVKPPGVPAYLLASTFRI